MLNTCGAKQSKVFDSVIHVDRLDRFEREAHLVRGAGMGVNGTLDMCFLQAVDWITGGDGKDAESFCVHPLIRALVLTLNDSKRFASWRDELKPFVSRTVETNVNNGAKGQRGLMCADWSARTMAPMAIDAYDRTPYLAQIVRDIPPIIKESTTALAARDTLRETSRRLRECCFSVDPFRAADAVTYAANVCDRHYQCGFRCY